MIPLLLLMLVHAYLAQYQTSWTIPLKTSPTALRITSSGKSNHQHIMAGYETGELEIIDGHTKQIVKSMQLFDEAVTQIEVDSENGVIFAVGSINMVQLDHQYNIRNVFTYQQKITQLSLSKFDQRISFANFQSGNQIISLQYYSGKDGVDSAKIWPSIVQYEIVQMSLHHYYLYTVGKDRESFKIQKINANIDMNTNKISFQKENFLQRKFSFKIQQLILDRKQNSISDEQLLIITDDGTIFYTRAGNIVTYIPYSIASNQHLITVDFCQNGFISIIHERKLNNEYSEYFLTLIRKDNLFSHKVILLNQLFGDINDIERLDCNHNLIVLQGKAKQLYILQSFSVFSIQQYSIQLFFILAFTLILLYLFYRSPSKNIDENNSETQTQSTQNKDPQSEQKQSQNTQSIKIPNKGKRKKRKGD